MQITSHKTQNGCTKNSWLFVFLVSNKACILNQHIGVNLGRQGVCKQPLDQMGKEKERITPPPKPKKKKTALLH